METMTGVQCEKGTRGRARYARIDLDKYGMTMDELQAFLNGIMSNKSSRNVDGQDGTSQFRLIPNDETKAALEEAHTQKLKTYENVDAFFEDLYS